MVKAYRKPWDLFPKVPSSLRLANCSFVSILFLHGGQRLPGYTYKRILEITQRSCLPNAFFVREHGEHPLPPSKRRACSGRWEAWVLAGCASSETCCWRAPSHAALLLSPRGSAGQLVWQMSLGQSPQCHGWVLRSTCKPFSSLHQGHQERQLDDSIFSTG